MAGWVMEDREWVWDCNVPDPEDPENYIFPDEKEDESELVPAFLI